MSMNRLRLGAKWALLAFVAVSFAAAAADSLGLRRAAAAHAGAAAPGNAAKPWVAYYLHARVRCPTCKSIEAQSRAALAEFERAGRLEWRDIDFQAPENKKYARHFDVAFATLVLAAGDADPPAKWRSLDKVWDLHEDPPAFQAFVQAEFRKLTEDGR